MLFLYICIIISLIVIIMFSWNFKVIGLKLLLPLILLLFPLSLLYCLGYILIIGEDYYSLLLDMIYFYYIFTNDLNTLTYTALVIFIQINAGLITILISLKVFISITMLVGNIIHILF